MRSAGTSKRSAGSQRRSTNGIGRVSNMLEKAALTNLSTLETLQVLWNPQAYWVRKKRRFSCAFSPPVAGGVSPPDLERFGTRLLFDTTEFEGPERDSRSRLERLEGWTRPDPETGMLPEVVFSWGGFRFRGTIEELSEEWVMFDPDGTPTRGWVDIVLRR